MSLDADIVVVGAGIAGPALPRKRPSMRPVLILESEEQPGYHSTGDRRPSGPKAMAGRSSSR
jgi:flavin-dependent dehydrogenase